MNHIFFMFITRFSHGDTNLNSHIVHHLKYSRNHSISLSSSAHALHCKSCGSPNIFDLGFTKPSKINLDDFNPKPDLLFCRHCNIKDMQLWQPIVDECRINPNLCPSAIDCKMVNFHKLLQLEDAWKAGKNHAKLTDFKGTKQSAHTDYKNRVIKMTKNKYETSEEYRGIQMPLLEMEKEQDQQVKEQITADNLTLDWDLDRSDLKFKKVVYFRLPCFDEINGYRIALGDKLMLSLKTRGNINKYGQHDHITTDGDNEEAFEDHVNHKTNEWKCAGHIIKIPTTHRYTPTSHSVKHDSGQIFGFEMVEPDHKTAPTNVKKGFSLTYIWQDVCFQRMRAATNLIVKDKDCVSKEICHTILGINNEDSNDEKVQLSPAPLNLDIKLKDGEQLTLNESQENAVRTCLQNSFSLIQGPPGTGKTQVSTALVKHFVDAWGPGQNVLVTAPSNIAVDQLACRIAETGLKVVRVMARSRENIQTMADELALHKMVIDSKIPEDQRYKNYDLYYQHKSTLGINTYDDYKTRCKYWNEYMAAKNERESVYLKNAEVICTTCMGAGDKRLTGFNFKAVIIDEATQATESETLIPITKGAKQVVLVGDQNQLGPVVLCKKAAKAGLGISLYERCINMGIDAIRLNVQYRMHPSLAKFPSDVFYDGTIKNGVQATQRTDEKLNTFWPVENFPSFFFRCFGKEQNSSNGTSFMNPNEAVEVEKLVFKLLKSGVPADKIGLITPYEGQRTYLLTWLQHISKDETRRIEVDSLSNYPKIEVASINSFQGREKDYIILSIVRANRFDKIGFIGDPRRLNVALTRAKKGLIIVGNTASLHASDHWLKLLDYYGTKDALVTGDILSKEKVWWKVEDYTPRFKKEEEVKFLTTEDEGKLMKRITKTIGFTDGSDNLSSGDENVPKWSKKYPDLCRFHENQPADPLFIQLLEFLESSMTKEMTFYKLFAGIKKVTKTLLLKIILNDQIVNCDISQNNFKKMTRNLAKYILRFEETELENLTNYAVKNGLKNENLFDAGCQKILNWNPVIALEQFQPAGNYNIEKFNSGFRIGLTFGDEEDEDEECFEAEGSDKGKVKDKVALMALKSNGCKDNYMRSLKAWKVDEESEDHDEEHVKSELPVQFEIVTCYTKGSCTNNNTKIFPRGAGIGVHFPTKKELDISEPIGKFEIKLADDNIEIRRNNTADLEAIHQALLTAQKNLIKKLTVKTAHKMSVNYLVKWGPDWVATGVWKTVNGKQVVHRDQILKCIGIMKTVDTSIIHERSGPRDFNSPMGIAQNYARVAAQKDLDDPENSSNLNNMQGGFQGHQQNHQLLTRRRVSVTDDEESESGIRQQSTPRSPGHDETRYPFHQKLATEWSKNNRALFIKSNKLFTSFLYRLEKDEKHMFIRIDINSWTKVSGCGNFHSLEVDLNLIINDHKYFMMCRAPSDFNKMSRIFIEHIAAIHNGYDRLDANKDFRRIGRNDKKLSKKVFIENAVQHMINLTDTSLANQVMIDDSSEGASSNVLEYMHDREEYFVAQLPCFRPRWHEHLQGNTFRDLLIEEQSFRENAFSRPGTNPRATQFAPAQIIQVRNQNSLLSQISAGRPNPQSTSTPISRTTGFSVQPVNSDSDDGFLPISLSSRPTFEDQFFQKYPEFNGEFDPHPIFKKLIKTLEQESESIVFKLDLEIHRNNTNFDETDTPNRLSIRILINNQRYHLQSIPRASYLEKTKNIALCIFQNCEPSQITNNQHIQNKFNFLRFIKSWRPSETCRAFLDSNNVPYQVLHKDKKARMIVRLTVSKTENEEEVKQNFEGVAQQLEDAKKMAILKFLKDAEWIGLYAAWVNRVEKSWVARA